MKKIIGRKKEQNILENIFRSEKAEFLAVYGRRRVGKTYLIQHFFESKKTILFNVTGSLNTPMTEQIDNFTSQLGEVFYGGAQIIREKNWNKSFQLLTEAITKTDKNQKIILFFDELPWMATKNSRILQNLDYYWNQYWSFDNRIKLIVCGSSASWIINKIINNKGGLYNRITHSILLEPFNLRETKEFLIQRKFKLSNQQITELYMILGGIPHYLEKLQKSLSIRQNVEELAFSKQSFLFSEFDNLFHSVFNNADLYTALIKNIAQKKSGISQEELFKETAIISKGGRVTDKLKALEEAGFIISFTPYLHSKKGIYYKVIDEYTLFYLNWIEPAKKTLLKRGVKKNYWESMTKTPTWENWAGYAFEAICYKHLTQISDALDIAATATPNGWRYMPTKKDKEMGAQIDLLFDRQDDSMTLCEIKYTNQPFIIDKSYSSALNRKVTVFRQQTRTQKQLFIAFISANGLKPTLYSQEMVSGLVTLDDLFG